MKSPEIEPIILLLAALLIFFTAALFVSEKLFPQDGQIFQVISGLLTGIGGALMMRVKPPSDKSHDPKTTPDTQ